jgi:tRNA 2-(methylsulfanyl)-N6-isopentenyladenosine37 hydroxylase
MRHGRASNELPLLSRTPDGWAALVLQEPLALLNDHAYLEKKAASNALELLNRWPEPSSPREWVLALAAIACDEASHLSAVIRFLDHRGGQLERTHRNDYARALRTSVRTGQGNQELLDRLLVSALIEVRSCERFTTLARYCKDRDGELGRFYHRLASSELGHYTVFLRLAALVVPPVDVETRWREMLGFEATVIAAQLPGPRLHSGLP